MNAGKSLGSPFENDMLRHQCPDSPYAAGDYLIHQVVRHVIVYAAPEHTLPRSVMCSCGWTASREKAEQMAYKDALRDLVAEWQLHVREAEALGSLKH